MKLISMTDLVLQNVESKTMKLSKIADYANFLKKPLTLGMFVPCDDDGNVLAEPLHIELYEGSTYDVDCKIYEIAKSKVLFTGFNSALNSENCQISVINNSFRASIIYERYYPSQQEKLKIIEDLISYNLDLSVSF